MHFVQRISRICPKELAILQYLVCGSYESKKVREFLSVQVGVGRGDIYRKRGGLINKYIYIYHLGVGGKNHLDFAIHGNFCF